MSHDPDPILPRFTPGGSWAAALRWFQLLVLRNWSFNRSLTDLIYNIFFDLADTPDLATAPVSWDQLLNFRHINAYRFIIDDHLLDIGMTAEWPPPACVYATSLVDMTVVEHSMRNAWLELRRHYRDTVGAPMTAVGFRLVLDARVWFERRLDASRQRALHSYTILLSYSREWAETVEAIGVPHPDWGDWACDWESDRQNAGLPASPLLDPIAPMSEGEGESDSCPSLVSPSDSD